MYGTSIDILHNHRHKHQEYISYMLTCSYITLYYYPTTGTRPTHTIPVLLLEWLIHNHSKMLSQLAGCL